MKFFAKLLLLCSVLIFGEIFFACKVFAVSDEASVNLEVTGFCNNNGTCEASLGESSFSCSVDCGCNDNGTCQAERGEDSGNCPADCFSILPGGGIPALYIRNISISDTTPHTTTISWQTTRPALCNLPLGLTSEYGKEIISGTQFVSAHSAKLIELEVSTVYHYRITCKDALDFSAGTSDQYFSTLSVLNNVSNLKISSGDRQLILKWDNPLDSDFKMVRIVRGVDFYPIYPEQAGVVYEGKNNFFVDSGLTNGTKYYYTVFAYNVVGDHSSSGAIVSGTPHAEPVVPPPPPIIPPVVTPPPIIPPTTWEMSFGEFNFITEPVEIVWLGETVFKAPVDKQMIVSIYDKQLPPLSKTIIVTIENKDEAFSFLLSSDKAKTLHEATIPPALGSGDYSITISIFNQENELIDEVSGELRLRQSAPVFWFRWYYELPVYIITLLLMLALIIFILRKERRKKV